jgi:hypothetical protein
MQTFKVTVKRYFPRVQLFVLLLNSRTQVFLMFSFTAGIGNP